MQAFPCPFHWSHHLSLDKPARYCTMPRTRQAKKKEAKRPNKTKAAEAGVSAAQSVFAKVLAKVDKEKS